MTDFDPAQPPDDITATSTRPPADIGVEQPDADKAEQTRPIGDEARDEMPEAIPLDADEADVAEQHRDVDVDDDDNR